MSESGAVALPEPRDDEEGPALSFPDLPRVELDQLLTQLVDRAQEVLQTQSRLRGLLRANQLVSSDLTSSAVLHRTVRAARDLVGARYALLDVVGPTGELVDAASAGRPTADAGAARLDETIQVRGEVFGYLHLVGSSAEPFSAEDRELARALTSTVGISLQNARLYESARRREEWLRASAAITQRLLAAEHSGGARPLDVVTQGMRDVAGADIVALVRPAEEGDDPTLLRIETMLGPAGAGTAPVPAGRLVREGSLPGRVLATGKPVCVPDAAGADIGSLPWAGVAVGPVLAVPLTGPRTVHGVLCAARARGRPPFSGDDLEMAGSFAGQAAVAVELTEARAEQQRAAMLDERDRIGTALHDTVVQRLFGAGLSLQGALAGLGPGRAAERVQATVGEIDAIINQIRSTVFQLQSNDPAGADLGARVLSVVGGLAPALGFEPGLRVSGRLPDNLPVDLVDDACGVLDDLLTELSRSTSVQHVEVEVTVGRDGLAVDVRHDQSDDDGADGLRSLPGVHRRAERHGGSLSCVPLGGSWTYLSWSVPWPGGRAPRPGE